jgi:excisionase family DNA binding protein
MGTKFISLPALADLTGLPESWLRRAADSGEIPFLRIGRRRMFDPTAVERVLARRATIAMTKQAHGVR